jgi:hypothetical protein
MLALWRRESRPLANGLAYLNRGSTTRRGRFSDECPRALRLTSSETAYAGLRDAKPTSFDGAATHKISVLAFSEYWGYGDARIRNVCFSH